MFSPAHDALILDAPLSKHRALACAKESSATHSHSSHLTLPHKVIHGKEYSYYCDKAVWKGQENRQGKADRQRYGNPDHLGLQKPLCIRIHWGLLVLSSKIALVSKYLLTAA